ncbi:conserved hypothetical protein [Kribbella flavida DSM 17836]|uniref:Fenitrothion hydrolase n=1 Tax=Kribbella flavida (strain DSM 17836 / JCM 10339 / NBRC 14399) TaxID=479435 RepID=D2PNK8_KRIFD|nr:hypothetical protein [Kribbella flavida]ADB30860.1 conserved hypothetical protein [Kribbella flavida DSM 17836]
MIPLHGIGGRGDLPVPLWLAVYSAAAAVAISFFALAAFWSQPRFERSAGTPLVVLTRCVDARATRWVLKAIGLLALALLLGAAWFGNDSPALNPAPTWLYVWIWVGIIPISLLFGPVWRLVNPLRTLSALARRTAYRRLPDRVSYWPAVAGLFAFLWLELAYPEGSDPRVVALFVTAYAVLNVAAGIIFGPRWFRVGDSFEVYAELLAKLSPIGRGTGGRLVLRNPLAGLATMPQEPGLVGLLCLLLGSTAFDGISRWSAWTGPTGQLGAAQHIAAHTGGLLATVAIVALLFLGATRATGSPQVRPGAVGHAGLPGAFAHSLVPIAIGYAVAHYFSSAMFQGQAGVLLATDPFGRGWDLLGVGATRIDYGFLGTGLIAGVQLGAIVLGHVLGVVSAHDRATGLFRRRQLRRAQYPLLAAMVAFTAGGIALVTAS